VAYNFEIRRENVAPLSGKTHFECDGKNIGLPSEYRHWPGTLRTTLGDGKPMSMSRAITRNTMGNQGKSPPRMDVLYVQLSTGITLLVHS
jgi:hypothetical protein